MRFVRQLLVPVTGIVVGSAVWVSMGVMDQLSIDGRMTRVALLPSWLAWAGLVLLATALVAIVQRIASHRAVAAESGTDPFWMLPLVALAVLVVPFLPWVADRWPVFQVLAGPFRWMVWTAVAGLLVWVAWQQAWLRPAPFPIRSRAARTAAVWLAVFLASGWAAVNLTRTVLFPSGDEPHYLVIAQSLWRDGDLKIENNHTRGDYLEYYNAPLDPHYLTRGVDQEIYSVHPVGMPVLVAPVYAAGGYPLVVFAFVLMAATAATLMWRALAAWLPDASAATFGWAAVVTSAPFLLNTLTIYPEIPAALCVALAFTIAQRTPESPHVLARDWRWLVSGVAVAALPWLSTKYAPMSAALVTVLLGRLWLRWTKWPTFEPAPGAWRASALIVAPYVASLAGWFAFFQVYWGAPWPSGPYGPLTQTTPLNLVFGAPGLLFDQEYGLLPYAPALILAAPGLWVMLRRGGEERRIAVETGLVFGALLGTVGAFLIWWGGSAVVGRPLVSGLLLLALPIAVQFASAPAGSARRAAQHLLVWFGAAITIALIVGQNGLLLANQRDGTSSLLTWLSPGWELWSRVPTFVQGHTDVMAAWMQSLAWLAVALACGLLLARVRTESAGRAALAAAATLGTGLLAGVWIASLLPEPVDHPDANLDARSRLAALEGFDQSRRPLAIVYDPLRVEPARSVVEHLVLSVRAGLRTDPQPLRVLHNGRFSLPPGRYRVAVQWTGHQDGGTAPLEALELQVGRIGPPWRSWFVSPAAAEPWSAEIQLPVRAEFIGLRGSPALERAVEAITISSLEIVDGSRWPDTPPVLGAAAYGDISVFFHDELTHSETHGFWALGARETVVTIAMPARDAGVRIRVHSGDRPNRVALATRSWQQTLDLVPGVTEDVDVPSSPEAVFPLTITADDGFVPADVNPASNDQRKLGAWIEVESGR